MLMNGAYPHFLKARILSDHGHLGNHQTSAFLAENMGETLQHVCLAHLSNRNNTPELALQALSRAFSEKGTILNGHPKITVLKRHMPSEVIPV
jgi:phosphoribosyl 1,2-cyclic phosphodiesterase